MMTPAVPDPTVEALAAASRPHVHAQRGAGLGCWGCDWFAPFTEVGNNDWDAWHRHVGTVLAPILAEHTERAVREALEAAAVRVDEECPHEPDEHAEGCCDLCDYAFAAAATVREGGQS